MSNTLFVKLAFQSNQAYIIQEYCINKFKPELECDGKCYLKTVLEEEQNNNQPSTTLEEEETVHWSVSELIEPYTEADITKQKYVPTTIAGLKLDVITSIDHPPIG